MKTKNLILLLIYIVILVLQISMFAVDNYITLDFYPSKLLEKLLGSDVNDYVLKVELLVNNVIDNDGNLSDEQKQKAKKDLISPIKEKTKTFINDFYIKFNMGLLKGCTSVPEHMKTLGLENDPIISKYNIDVSQIQTKLDEEFYPLFKCYYYDGPELSEAFGDIGKYMSYVRIAIILLFVANSFIILIIFGKLLRGKKLILFTFIKNIIGFFVGIIFTILFSIFFFLPSIIKNFNVSLSDYGIDDFDNTSILRIDNWGPSFEILIAIVILTLIKTVFV